MMSMAIDVTERKQAEEQVPAYQDELRAMNTALSRAEERERRRIATYLHDEVAQALAMVRVKSGSLADAEETSSVPGSIEETRALLEQALQNVRSLTFELSSPILYEFGLVPALQWITEYFSKHYDIHIRFHDDGSDKPLGEEIRVALYRAVSELLVNIVKHAKAQNGKVSTRLVETDFEILVEDDGMGFRISRRGVTGRRDEIRPV